MIIDLIFGLLTDLSTQARETPTLAKPFENTSAPTQPLQSIQPRAQQTALTTLTDKYQSWVTPKRLVLLQAILGEGLVTCLFIFCVCAFQLNTIRSGHVDEQGLIVSAIGTAFCSIALIYSFADVSGAHFNCAVTFATVITGKTSWQKSK